MVVAVGKTHLAKWILAKCIKVCCDIMVVAQQKQQIKRLTTKQNNTKTYSNISIEIVFVVNALKH